MSSLSNSEASLLEAFLTEVGHIEKRAEIKRQVLTEHKGFHSDEVYEFLAQVPQRGITSADLKHFFNIHGLTADTEDINSLLALFDYNRDGVLDRSEFKRTVLSQELGFTERDRSGVNSSQEIQISLLKIFDEELGGIKTLERMKTEIRLRGPEFVLAMFYHLDTSKKGYIDVRDIHQFLGRTDPGLTYATSTRIIRRLDRDYDNRISLDEWEDNLRPLTLVIGNPFQMIEVRTPGPLYQNGPQEYTSGDPRSEISYHMTSYVNRQNPPTGSNTLVYSKSPNLRQSPAPQTRTKDSAYKSPNTRAFVEQDVSENPRGILSYKKTIGPETGGSVTYEDKVTVIDKSPDRAEKRTYIRTKFADGSEEVEERIYEPLTDLELRDERPLYQIKRYINEVPVNDTRYRPDQTNRTTESRYITSRSPLRSGQKNNIGHKDRTLQTGGSDTYQPSPIKNFRRFEERVEERTSLIRGDDNHIQRTGYSRSPIRSQYQDNRSETTRTETTRTEIGRHENRDVSLRYEYQDRDRYVHSPARHNRTLNNDTAYRREEILHRGPMNASYVNRDSVANPVIKQSRVVETFGRDGQEKDPNLQEEIITQHEFDDQNNRQVNTYIRKIYSPNREKTVYVEAPPQEKIVYYPQPVFERPAPIQELPKHFATPERLGTSISSSYKVETYEGSIKKQVPAFTASHNG